VKGLELQETSCHHAEAAKVLTRREKRERERREVREGNILYIFTQQK
jgi:hypothetical protein